MSYISGARLLPDEQVRIASTKMVEFASGVKGIALNLENENVGLNVLLIAPTRLVARTPNGTDRPIFPSDSAAGGPPEPDDGEEAPIGLPDDPNQIAPGDPEEIIDDLTSNLDRILRNTGRTLESEDGRSLREFVEDDVLWHGGDLLALQRIWIDFQENPEGSPFWVAADNLLRKYQHAARDEPDTPDPDAAPPVEADSPPVEADSPQSGGGGQDNLMGRTSIEVDSPPLQDQKGAGEAGTSGGPPESRRRKREDDDSGDDDSGGDPTPIVPGESPDPGGFASSFLGDFFSLFERKVLYKSAGLLVNNQMSPALR